MSSEITTAIISAIVSSSVAVFSAYVTTRSQVKQLERQFLLEYQAERIVHQLLELPKWKLRTFKAIKYHVAGFEDDELRRILIRIGAIRFEDNQKVEIWGLMSRNQDLIDSEYGTSNF